MSTLKTSRFLGTPRAAAGAADWVEQDDPGLAGGQSCRRGSTGGAAAPVRPRWCCTSTAAPSSAARWTAARRLSRACWRRPAASSSRWTTRWRRRIRFPQAAEAGHAALSWMHRNRRRLGGEGAAVLVAGEEAGGNLAAAVALMARDRQRPPLAGQILLSPMLDPCLGTASLRDADLERARLPVGERLGELPAAGRRRLPSLCGAGHLPAACAAAGDPADHVARRSDARRGAGVCRQAARRRRGGGAGWSSQSATGWPQSFMQGDRRRGRLAAGVAAAAAALHRGAAGGGS